MAGLMDIAKDVSQEFGVSKAEARKVVEFICSDITKYLGQGVPVNIRGFGVYKAKNMEARQIKSPQNGELVDVDPTVRCLFTASERMKTELKYQRGLITEEKYHELVKDDKDDAGEAAEPVTEEAAE